MTTASRSKTVNEAIEKAEKAFPHKPGQSDEDTYRMMRNRYEHMVADIGELPTLNDED